MRQGFAALDQQPIAAVQHTWLQMHRRQLWVAGALSFCSGSQRFANVLAMQCLRNSWQAIDTRLFLLTYQDSQPNVKTYGNVPAACSGEQQTGASSSCGVIAEGDCSQWANQEGTL